MCAARRLSVQNLQRPCKPDEIPFETTVDAPLAPVAIVGQERAVQALRFGIGIRRDGYNIFAIGPSGLGKQTLLRQFLQTHAAGEPVPTDWCHVHNFDDPGRPAVLELPPGTGVCLQRDMDRAVVTLRTGLRSAFESEEYRTRKKQILDRVREKQERTLAGIRDRAKERGVAVVHTDTGIVIAPIRDGVPLNAESFHSLPQDQRDKLQSKMEQVGAEIEAHFRMLQEWGRHQQEQLNTLDREMATTSAHQVLDSLQKKYDHLSNVHQYLSRVESDVIDNVHEFLEDGANDVESALRRALKREKSDGPPFRRYQINVLVDRSDQHGAPVIYEDNPTYTNLIGRIEHETQFGALMTNFTLVKPGALHRAAGGYLILDALKILQNPLVWDAIKRTIRSGEIKIESLGQALGLVPTVSLEPNPVALGNIKIVLTGERILYYLLSAMDPEFLELFKVLVDFEEHMDRHLENHQTYANMVATLVSTEGLRPFDRSAVARVIDHAARLAGDAEKLSVHMREIVDLLRETDYWANQEHHQIATADEVQKAIDAQLLRSGRIRERLREAMRRHDILVTTSGEQVGQINGLSVFRLGEHMFGHPTRITARVHLGKGEVIDIEREVSLGGPVHSKGVLILSGFLSARYAADFPLSLSATLVFEQTYGAVEGDSASLAELCALISSLADVPIKQSLAVTGSINQQGQVQSIGGVNEKIEGFFDVCQERGLTGDQGVLVPQSNVKNLMLRRDVVDAVKVGRFHIHAVEQVDDAVELLTGRPAGVRDGAGRFPEDSVNAKVEARLVTFAKGVRAFLSRPPHP